MNKSNFYSEKKIKSSLRAMKREKIGCEEVEIEDTILNKQVAKGNHSPFRNVMGNKIGPQLFSSSRKMLTKI